MNLRQPLSAADFLDQLKTDPPDIARDPTVEAGLQRLAKAVFRNDNAHPRLPNGYDETDTEILRTP